MGTGGTNFGCVGEYQGVYKGIVRNVEDPRKMKRLTVNVPVISRTDMEWAFPSQPQDDFYLPKVGDSVWVIFQGGDIRFPVWLPGWNYEANTDQFADIAYPRNNEDRATGVRVWRYGNHLIIASNDPGNEFIQIGDETLDNTVKITGGENDPSIEINSLGPLRVNAQGGVEWSTPGSNKTIQGNDREVATGQKEIAAGEKLTLQGVSEVELSSNGDINIITSPAAKIKVTAGITELDQRGIEITTEKTIVKHPIETDVEAPLNKITATATNEIKAPVNKMSGDATNEIDAPQNFIGTVTGNVSEPVVKGSQLIAILTELSTILSTLLPLTTVPGSPTAPNPANTAQIAAWAAKFAQILSTKSFTG